ncbi:MAG: hypothetical protein II704_00145 [Erysipelotrichaceae bacterium]|nr:hypothetical protein [Erysipelotrichaceae bacterium]
MTKTKIRIQDDPALRERLDEEYEKSSQARMCRYALKLSEHILELAQYPQRDQAVIREAYEVLEQRLSGQVSMQGVRQAAFRIHQLARTSEDTVTSTALRVTGQAIASGHVKEHAMVASDYAVKIINLLYPDDLEAVRKERQWQLDCLREIDE